MKRILVCADSSAYTEVTCRYAAWAAQRLGAEVSGVYVSDVWRYETSFLSDLGGSLGIQPYHDMLGRMEVLEAQKAELIETALRALFEREGLSDRFTFHHRTGNVVDHLAAFEQGPEGVDLVMMGKRGERADFATEHLGPTMERLVRASTKPCLVAPREYRPIKSLLLAYDGSPSAKKALHWLVQAVAFKDIAVHLVSAAATSDEAAAAQTLREGESLLRSGGWQPVCQLLAGEPGEAIADYLAHQKLDWLIMGAYGHGAMRRLIIGSTTTDLIRRCHVPVMLFR